MSGNIGVLSAEERLLQKIKCLVACSLHPNPLPPSAGLPTGRVFGKIVPLGKSTQFYWDLILLEIYLSCRYIDESESK